jgi:multimeric flavodoxin WrbA
MNIMHISGSPRKKSNTDYLLKYLQSLIGGEFIKLTDYKIEPCIACWACIKSSVCMIDDDMTKVLIPILLKADVIVLGSPVYFNNVSAQLKAFMDRTWCLRGKLKNKIGGAIVVGRRDGIESAIVAINSFFLKHEMIPANRGVYGLAFKEEEIKEDKEAIELIKSLGDRIKELVGILHVH